MKYLGQVFYKEKRFILDIPHNLSSWEAEAGVL
jgi:hypothetical protein